jgi:hypothetical protein
MGQLAKLPVAGIGRPPRQQTYELEIAVLLVAVVTALYIWVARVSLPASSSLFGHSLGVVGFLLMLATETLYSLRKRARGRAYGRMSTWLQWHIVMGIVGSYMVLLHTAWQFQGLAGVVTLLTAVVVLSGFVGRYVYTAIPRTLDGAEITLERLEGRRREVGDALTALARSTPELASAIGDAEAILQTASPAASGPVGTILRRPLLARRDRAALRRAMAPLQRLAPTTAAEVAVLLAEQATLQRQLVALDTARRLLALWHTVHIPLGVALFALSFVHIGAALYYATLLK